MVFWIWEKDMIKLLKYTNFKQEFAEDFLEVYKTHADHLTNSLRLNEITTLTFFPILMQNK